MSLCRVSFALKVTCLSTPVGNIAKGALSNPVLQIHVYVCILVLNPFVGHLFDPLYCARNN